MLVAAVAGAAGVAKLVQDNKVGRRNLKPVLKSPGFRPRLKLIYDKLLPYVSFKLKLCLYSAAAAPPPPPVKGKGKR